jgi:hypothetical protein
MLLEKTPENAEVSLPYRGVQIGDGRHQTLRSRF